MCRLRGPMISPCATRPGSSVSPGSLGRRYGDDGMAAGIELVGLTKRFHHGHAAAVDDIDLSVAGGEFFSLLGPSGCGKTTTLRLVAGFEEPTAGRILLDGVDVSGVPPHKRNVNTVFQSYALFPFMSVFDNVAFGLRYAGCSKSKLKTRVGEALALVDMTSFSSRRPSQLSGGQQQRIALARALVLNPSVLLLDEPLGALDAKLRRSLKVELKALQERVGITFIYVTHDQEEALTMSDRSGSGSRSTGRRGPTGCRRWWSGWSTWARPPRSCSGSRPGSRCRRSFPTTSRRRRGRRAPRCTASCRLTRSAFWRRLPLPLLRRRSRSRARA